MQDYLALQRLRSDLLVPIRRHDICNDWPKRAKSKTLFWPDPPRANEKVLINRVVPVVVC